MSVRHINARPGEYIAVHRKGRSASAGGGDTGTMSAVGMIAVILAVLLFWKIILKAIFIACAAVLAITLAAGALHLLWKFRRELRDDAGRIVKTLRSAASRCRAKCVAVCEAIRSRFRKRPGAR